MPFTPVYIYFCFLQVKSQFIEDNCFQCPMLESSLGGSVCDTWLKSCHQPKCPSWLSCSHFLHLYVTFIDSEDVCDARGSGDTASGVISFSRLAMQPPAVLTSWHSAVSVSSPLGAQKSSWAGALPCCLILPASSMGLTFLVSSILRRMGWENVEMMLKTWAQI